MNDIYEDLVMRYGLEEVLERLDIEPAFVLRYLEEQGYIDLEELE